MAANVSFDIVVAHATKRGSFFGSVPGAPAQGIYRPMQARSVG